MRTVVKSRREGFVCSDCGYKAVRRMGRCPECGGWGSMMEQEPAGDPSPGGLSSVSRLPAPSAATLLSETTTADGPRIPSGMSEMDRVLGGGLVPGGVVLLGGDPGIGKSTLLLQTLQAVAETGGPVVYLSGEESARQIRLRADRMGASGEGILIVTDPDLPAGLARAIESEATYIGIDSIQAVRCPHLESAPGSMQQIRECTALAVGVAKTEGIPTVITGHVTKEGGLAGPKSLEHMVDTVLYFEGTAGHVYRIVRAVKNRFGSTDEVGIFEMRDAGLVEVMNPSALCLSDRVEPVAGCAVVAGMQGSRPLLVEVQSLVSQPQFGSARRVVSGIDSNRLALILAALERRAEVAISTSDVFVSAAGGMRLAEPAADLAIALAAASAAAERPGAGTWCMVGEVALTGEIRAVAHLRQRVGEAARMGFARVLVPAQNLESFGLSDQLAIEVVPVDLLADAVQRFLGTRQRVEVRRETHQHQR